jgi:glutamate synthase domain-containing protein 2
MKKTAIARWADLEPAKPTYALAANVDLVVIRWPEPIESGEAGVSVLYGRCLHRGALLADGHVRGDDLICGVHNWDYRYRTGVSAYNPKERLANFTAWVEDDQVWVDADEIATWERDNPQAYNRDDYLGLYDDLHGAAEEPHNAYIRRLAKEGLSKLGHHGRIDAMGVPYDQLPKWADIQILTAQVHKLPLLDDDPVGTEVVIGPNAKKPLKLDIPLMVSDMSFGALSEEAKVALARGAELAGTGICSGEGGMLPEEQDGEQPLFLRAGLGALRLFDGQGQRAQAFHFKGGPGRQDRHRRPPARQQGARQDRRGARAERGRVAISPPRFPDWHGLAEFRDFAAAVREATGGIPVGFKLSAQHIEKDIDAALEVGCDYIILDGRGGGTGAAPLLFRDNISVPTIPALARARRHLDRSDAAGITLVITGGLRLPADYVKAMALGADAIALSNAPMQAIGCLGMRACHTDNCPVGIATQKNDLRAGSRSSNPRSS